jgi:hypothetical protein
VIGGHAAAGGCIDAFDAVSGTMRKLAAIGCLAFLLASVPLCPSAGAEAPAAACTAVRDAALNLLDQEATTLATAFDNDIAVAESPEYELLKAKEALLEEIAGERQAVLERYRRCLASAPPVR